MNMNASTLLITSAVFHALWNFSLKRSTNKLGAALAFMIVATLLNALYAITSAPAPLLSSPLIVGTVSAGLFEGIYFYLLNTAYSKQALGVAYTIMRGGAMVLVWSISTIALGESIDLTNGIGVLTILLGITLVQRTFKATEFFATGAYAAYTCAACIAGYHICYGLAVRTGTAPALIFASAMTIGVATYVACSRGKAFSCAYKALRAETGLIAFGGSACALSFFLFLTALQIVEPGRAISLRNTSVAFGALLSVFAGEKLEKIQWLGVCLVIAGVFGLM